MRNKSRKHFLGILVLCLAALLASGCRTTQRSSQIQPQVKYEMEEQTKESPKEKKPVDPAGLGLVGEVISWLNFLDCIVWLCTL